MHCILCRELVAKHKDGFSGASVLTKTSAWEVLRGTFCVMGGSLACAKCPEKLKEQEKLRDFNARLPECLISCSEEIGWRRW